MSNVAKSEHTLLDGNLKNMWKDERITASATVIFLKLGNISQGFNNVNQRVIDLTVLQLTNLICIYLLRIIEFITIADMHSP